MESFDRKGIDLIRFILAFFVIAIHYPPFKNNEILNLLISNCIARIAVPFFFIVSGYFVFYKMESDDRQHTEFALLRYARRILRIYIIWTAIYIPIIIQKNIIAESDAKSVAYALVIWLKECIFTASYAHLWYLYAVIIATLMLAVFMKYGLPIKGILFISFGLYLLGLLPQTYSGLLAWVYNYSFIHKLFRILSRIILTTRNGVFEGLLFMSIGACFAQQNVAVLHINSRKRVRQFLVLSMMLLLCEAITLHKIGWDREHDMYFFLIPVSSFLFLYAHSYTPIIMRADMKQLRVIGSLVYYIHPLVGYIILHITQRLGKVTNWGALFILVCVVSLLDSYIIQKLSTYDRFKCLRILYK